ACKKEPPPPPAPTGPNQDSLAQARADSIAAARRAAEEAAQRAAEERARREREAAVAEARTTLQANIHFDYDKSEIREDAAAILRRKVDVLRASPQVQLQIAGHADERGSTEYNIALGNRRAEAARQFLVGFGLAESRFSIISYGEERPIAQGHDEAAWAQNRRDEFHITAGANAINPPGN
ncbi:MAG: peptidoglycan-associated lipoprotein Pal, partial [Gemmatimonadota bacterium]